MKKNFTLLGNAVLLKNGELRTAPDILTEIRRAIIILPIKISISTALIT
jgi:hypothetical protein